MEKFRKSLALLFVLVMVLTIIPIGVINASALSFSDYKTKYTAFINDARWQNGISWGYYQAPKLSSWGSKGCCAYAADFEYYMYGTKGWAGTAFTSAESITSGSILHINTPSGGEHWLVVLERDGSTLYTAEGNFNSGVHITNTFYRVYNGYLQQEGYYNSSNQWVNSWANCTLVYGYNYNITDHNLTDFSFSYPDSIFSNQEITVSWNYSYPTANFWLCVLNEDDSVYKRFEDLGTDTSCNVGTLEKGTYRFHLEWYEGDTLCIKQSEFFTVSDFAASTNNNDGVKASDKIQIYSQWNYDAFGSVDNSWICGSGCGLLTIGHALQWLGVIGRDQESPNATICNIFVESGYAGTVLWSERNNTLNFIASKYPGFSFEYNTDLRSIINNGGVALINKYGHQYLAVDISSDSNYVHIVDSCLTVPNQNNVAVYSYNSNTGIFDQTSVANCAARNDIRWYCADPYTNKMVKANNSNPLYAGGEYWVKYSEVSGSTQIGLYSTHTHSYGAWQTVTAATCTADGSQKRVCSCGDTQTETIPALGHDLTLTPAKAATATASGNNAYYTCSRCNKVFKADGVTETTVEAETIPALGDVNISVLTYEISDGEVTITDCDTSAAGALIIPAQIEGYPVTSIGENAFWNCSGLTSITIPSSVTSIGDYAFRSCSGLTSIEIPSSVTYIGDCAFEDCSKLTRVTFAERSQCRSIGDFAFDNCRGLTSIEIPSSVKSIGYFAFAYCSSLISITVDAKNSAYSNDAQEVLYNKDKTILICCPGGKTECEIPSSVKCVEDVAFWGCSSLISITVDAKNSAYSNDAQEVL
ncbi:MAG: leucine-rich repeat domain-containing protein, partial [Clostridia bacterium]|nr:leucine-rich repeat domain-containing protein [Clostridia bacterium]